MIRNTNAIETPLSTSVIWIILFIFSYSILAYYTLLYYPGSLSVSLYYVSISGPYPNTALENEIDDND